MSESLAFAHPWLLWGLAVLPLLAVLRWAQRRREAVPFPPLELRPAPAHRRRLGRWALPIELALVAAALVGAAGPYRETRLELVDDPGIDVVLALDVSLSMLAEDFPPNRLEALRGLARRLLATGGGNRFGIVIFAGDTYVQVPLTTDHASLAALLDGVTVYALDQAESGGTAVGDALLVAADRLLRARLPGRDQAVILITDGESNAGIEPVLAARWLARQQIALHAVGVGGEEPVAVSFEGRPVGGENAYLAVLDESELVAVAAAAGGRFYRATDLGVLEEIFAELARLDRAPLEKRTFARRVSYASALALGALALFALHLAVGGVALRRPWR